MLKIGKNGNNKFCFHNSSNRYVGYLAHFSFTNRFACLNTKLEKRGGKQWTYINPNNSKAQQGYIFIYKKWINTTLNCEAYSCFEGVSSNHRIISAKICLSLCRKKK